MEEVPVVKLDFNSISQNYIIQDTTTNLSFVKVWKLLQAKGVKNNKWHLRLYDRTLKGVNPFMPNLSPDIKNRIIVEIKRNPMYYLREIVRIPVPGGTLRFDLHRGNLAIIWAMLNSVDFIVELPRQKYKTVTIAAVMTWFMYFGTMNSHCLFSNKALNDAKNNLARFKDIVDKLPEFVKDAILSPEDNNKIEGVVLAITNNKIDTAGMPMSEEMADKMGRGMSIPFGWFDEFAFLKHNDIVYKSAVPAISKVSEIAEAKGMPHCKIISTTPNNLDSEEGAFCYELLDGACMFVEDFYDWDVPTIKQFIEDNSSTNFLRIKFTWKELGLTHAWYTKQCKELVNDRLKIKRELDLEWTKATDNSVFTEEQLDLISKKMEQSIGTQVIDLSVPINDEVEKLVEKYFSDDTPEEDREALAEIQGEADTSDITDEVETPTGSGRLFHLVLYRELDASKRYLIGVDTAGGLRRDYSTMTILDPDDLKPVGFFKNNTVDIVLFANIITWVVKKLIPNSVLFIERNSYGKGVIDILVRRIPKNIFYSYRLKDSEKSKGKVKRRKEDLIFGINTDATSRDLMIDLLKTIVDEEYEVFSYEELYADVKGLEYAKNGKIEHSSTSHDDVLMAYLMVRYAIYYAPNIGRFLATKADAMATVKAKIKQLYADHAKQDRTNTDDLKSETPQFDLAKFAVLSMEGKSREEILEILNVKPINARNTGSVNSRALAMLGGKKR